MPGGFKSDYIADFIGGESTDSEIYVDNFSSLSGSTKNSISFYNDSRFKKDLLNTKAGIVILKKSDVDLRKGASIIVDDPYLAFAKISNLFYQSQRSSLIHEKAYISTSAKIGENFSIGAFSSIGNDVEVGDNVFIGANSTIGDYVAIGSNTIIHSNVTIESKVHIGKTCEVYSGARLGTSGFGYARDKDGRWLNIPQVGNVKIGNNVDIGANTTIDRGAIDDTIIHDNVKIDNLVQIAHNCVIGENTIIAGCAGIAGSTKIGKNCMLGGAVMIKGHISIADGTIISGGSTIAKSIYKPGKRFSSLFPYNIDHTDWLRIAYNLKKLGKKND
jgi:UDP-3-O-[3-hydroxymyristoyl] glucosamine N-acyltransferase